MKINRKTNRGKMDSKRLDETLDDWNEYKTEIIEKKISPKEDNEEKKLRAPICCVLGHVDTGKTKILDVIRKTSVQEGEAGGITQQIGATYFPVEALKKKTKAVIENFEFTIPGLLIIDTPGHESFSNLRTRGSSLCNIAVLVVDIMHGIEPQTKESISILRARKTPFVVALNKIDRLYGWKSNPELSFKKNFSLQKNSVKEEFEQRLKNTIAMLSSEGLNSELFIRNKDIRKTVSLIPTSAHTSDGIADLLLVICSLTQKMMSKKLLYVSVLECTVLEVKVVSGLGTTIDVILSNGMLNEGETIIIGGTNGPIVTSIRALLTPQPMRELRIKSQYVHHKSVHASLGVKIFAPDLEKAIAGSRLFIGRNEQEIEEAKKKVKEDIEQVLNSIKLNKKGVSVQASTLGSLEALLCFLEEKNIPCMHIGIGTLYKKDIIPAISVEKENAVVLCFDVKVDPEAAEIAERNCITIFKAEIIYHLFDMLIEYQKKISLEKKRKVCSKAVFPCLLKIVPGCVFNKKDPIVLGMNVLEGVLCVGTPLCVLNGETPLYIGNVSGIQRNHVSVLKARKNEPSVSVKIEMPNSSGSTPMVGRHFIENSQFVSKLTRESIDLLKDFFREEMSKEDWLLIKNKIKPIFGIV